MKRLAMWFTSLNVKVNCFEIMSHLSCLSTCDAECVWNKNDLKTREVWLESFFLLHKLLFLRFPMSRLNHLERFAVSPLLLSIHSQPC